MATNTQVNGYAKICQYLYQVDTLKKSAFNGGGLDNVHAKALYLVRKAFDWGLDQSISTVSEINPSLYSLCGAKLQKAISIYSGGSGGVVPSPSGTGAYQPAYIDYTVSGMASPNTTITSLTYSDWEGLQGLTELSVNQQVFQLNVGFTFNSAQGEIEFDLSPGNVYYPQNGDVITANGLYKIVTQ